jgi:2-iminobutanoate/2-iminopropanoate deaminase
VAEKDVVRTEAAPAPFQGAPYNQAITVGDLVFVAGQLGVAPGGSGMVGDGITEQTEQVMKNLAAILDASGSRTSSRRRSSSRIWATSQP